MANPNLYFSACLNLIFPKTFLLISVAWYGMWPVELVMSRSFLLLLLRRKFYFFSWVSCSVWAVCKNSRRNQEVHLTSKVESLMIYTIVLSSYRNLFHNCCVVSKKSPGFSTKNTLEYKASIFFENSSFFLKETRFFHSLAQGVY